MSETLSHDGYNACLPYYKSEYQKWEQQNRVEQGEDGENVPQGKIFEYIVNDAINQRALLSFDEQGTHSEHSTYSEDNNYRIDLKVQTGAYPSVNFAVDTTLNSFEHTQDLLEFDSDDPKDRHMFDKIAHTMNADPQNQSKSIKVPFGFSIAKDATTGEKVLIPRFILSVDSDKMHHMPNDELKMQSYQSKSQPDKPLYIGGENVIRPAKHNATAEINFIMYNEILMQADLMLKLLPEQEEWPKEESLRYKKQNIQKYNKNKIQKDLEHIKAKCNEAIDDCCEQMRGCWDMLDVFTLVENMPKTTDSQKELRKGIEAKLLKNDKQFKQIQDVCLFYENQALGENGAIKPSPLENNGAKHYVIQDRKWVLQVLRYPGGGLGGFQYRDLNLDSTPDRYGPSELSSYPRLINGKKENKTSAANMFFIDAIKSLILKENRSLIPDKKFFADNSYIDHDIYAAVYNKLGTDKINSAIRHLAEAVKYINDDSNIIKLISYLMNKKNEKGNYENVRGVPRIKSPYEY